MPRAGLTESRVVEEAERMADEVGLGQLSLTALAERLGVRQPSIYKHIDSMAGLRRSISLRAKAELGEVLARAAVGRSGGDAIRAMSQAYRSWARLHPGRYEAAQFAPAPGDAEDEAASWVVVQIIADVLAAYRLHGDDAIDAIRVLRSALHGFVALESSGAFGLKVDIDRSFDRLVRGMLVAFGSWTDQAAGQPTAGHRDDS
jgi:AcrR family transcriptional regulator